MGEVAIERRSDSYLARTVKGPGSPDDRTYTFAAERARLREKVEAKNRDAENLVNGLFQASKTASILYWSESGKAEALRDVLALLAEPDQNEER